ncbi:hypothetical protein Tco_0771528 [Tanacetum coccineum]|uniref:Uncharacterized protein n=1 Tax=Tanacetum coccineum TaxID=301880 RepID=A0ABQ4ZGC7_9ASTR
MYVPRPSPIIRKPDEKDKQSLPCMHSGSYYKVAPNTHYHSSSLGNLTNSIDNHIDPAATMVGDPTSGDVYTPWVFGILQHIIDQKDLNMRQRRWKREREPSKTEARKLGEQSRRRMLECLLVREILKRSGEIQIRVKSWNRDYDGNSLASNGRSWLPVYGEFTEVIVDDCRKSAFFMPIGKRYPLDKLSENVPKGGSHEAWNTCLNYL